MRRGGIALPKSFKRVYFPADPVMLIAISISLWPDRKTAFRPLFLAFE